MARTVFCDFRMVFYYFINMIDEMKKKRGIEIIGVKHSF